MKRNVILISIDGMRPEGFLQCKNPFIYEMMKRGSYTLAGSSVNPSVTLPCHMSMFHSVTPDRHGITTNLYVPMARPVSGLFEQILHAGGRSAMYYGWEPLRDVARPGSLKYAEYIWAYAADHTDGLLAESALRDIKKEKPDFEAGRELSGIGLLDLAPTIADLMGVSVPQEWEGTSVIKLLQKKEDK